MIFRRYWGPLLRLALLLLALAAPAALRAQAVEAEPVTLQSQCTATSDRSAGLEDMSGAISWNCEEASHSLVPKRTILRFDLDGNQQNLEYLITRRSPLSEVHLLAVDADGSTRSASFGWNELVPAHIGSSFKLPLPEITPDTRQVLVAIDNPTHVMIMQRAYLSEVDPGELPQGRRMNLLLALLCGMLTVPLVLNAAIYRILRERFVLWHSTLAISLIMMIVFNSGLAASLFNFPVSTTSPLTVHALAFAVAAGCMFSQSFIEPDRMHPGLRRALPWAAIASVLLGIAHATFPFVGRSWQTDLYYLAYIPILVLLIAVIVDSLRRGSRAARFQAAGWAPLLAVAFIRQLAQFTPILSPTDAMNLFYFGCVFEVVATTLGVTDRFMVMKHQRDRARTEAQMLEQLSERDTLTGLYNRRILEERFSEWRATGFSVLAVLDLDHFKHINDSFGHGVGDDVLRAVARALQPDDDTIVVRMGGEEFLILLRGPNASDRAEHRRRAVTQHVAAEMQLDRPVTASMGVVDAPLEAMPNAKLEAMYRRADELLYEAKKAGRNRVMSERLKTFGAGHRKSKAAA